MGTDQEVDDGQVRRTARVRRSGRDAPQAQQAEPLEPPRDLLMAPGFGARRLYQAYSASWNRHVDGVLTGPQFAVLSAIHAYPNSDQGSLAEAVALDTSTMADVSRRLEHHGLIAREESSVDARRKILALTPAGRDALSEAHRRTRRLDAALLAHLPEGRRAEVAAFLHDLGKAWELVAAQEQV